MHRLPIFTLAIALSLTSAACSAQTGRTLTDASSDAEDIVGTWQIVALWDSGREAPANVIADFQLSFTADTLVYDLGSTVMNATYRLDPTADPNQIDIQIEGRGTWHGIYALSGDTLKIVTPDSFDASESARSTAFESRAGSANDWYAILTRR